MFFLLSDSDGSEENIYNGSSQHKDQFVSGEGSSDLPLGTRKAVRTSSCVTDIEEDMLVSGSKSETSRDMVTRSLKSLSSSYSISDHQYSRILQRATPRVWKRLRECCHIKGLNIEYTVCHVTGNVYSLVYSSPHTPEKVVLDS